MFGIDFHPVVTLDGLVTFVGLVVGGITIWANVVYRFARLEMTNSRQNEMILNIVSEVKELKNVLISMARFDERIIALQKEVTELRHGKGFVENNVD